MRRGIITLMWIVLVLTGLTSTWAETDLDVTGQVRFRSEMDKKSFRSGARTLEYSDLRTRINLEAIKDGNARVFIQLQDSRRLGGQTADGDDLSGTLNDGKNVDLHQAYVHLDRVFFDGFGMKAGRFELNLGNQRVFGSVGWHNVGRSWEGVQLWLTSQPAVFSAFLLKRRELNDTRANRDFNVLVGQIALKEQDMEFFGVYEYDADNLDSTDTDVDVNALDRFTFGLYADRQFGRSDLEITGAYQMGTQRASVGASEYDIAAFMFSVELGLTVDPDKKTRIAAGIDYTSGDDNTSDDQIKTYNNLYYTGHKFRGYMDYFIGSNTLGLMDLAARFRTALNPHWALNVDAHYFTTAQSYAAADGDSKAMGVEIDASLATTAVRGVKLVWGASAFLPSEDYAGLDPDPGLWAYSMLIADF